MLARRHRFLPVGAALFLGACTSMHDISSSVVTAARAADRMIMGITSELSGTYHFDGDGSGRHPNLDLWTRQPSPCPAGHREEEGRGSGLEITLTDDGRAELREEAGVICIDPSGSSDYRRVQREAQGRYRSVGNQLWISLRGGDHELAFALDRQDRTLRLESGTATWRRAGARTESLAGNPGEVLRLLVVGLESVHVETTGTLHAPMEDVPAAAAPPVRHARLVTSSLGPHEPSHAVALQADSVLAAPLAKPGDVLDVFPFGGGAPISTLVLARHAAEGYYGCGGLLQGPSWAYLLDVDPSTLPSAEYTSEISAIAVRPNQTLSPGVAPERIRQAFAPHFRKRLDEAFRQAETHFRNGSYDGLPLADFRRSMYGETGVGSLAEARIHALRGPQARCISSQPAWGMILPSTRWAPRPIPGCWTIRVAFSSRLPVCALCCSSRILRRVRRRC
jgi:hypothetical protein